MPDRSESFQSNECSDVALSYATLPRAPKIAPNLFSTLQRSSPDSWQQLRATEHSVPGYYQWSVQPVQINRAEQHTVNTNFLGSPGRSLRNSPFQPTPAYGDYDSYPVLHWPPPPPTLEYSTVRMPRSSSIGRGDARRSAFAPQPRIQGPKRVDMPPEEDWRQKSMAPPMGVRRQNPTYSPHRTFSSPSDMYGTTSWRGPSAFHRHGR